MITLRPTVSLLAIAALLSCKPGASAQHHTPTPTAPAVASGGKGTATITTESLSGLDLIPNRKTGTFGIRINHRINQPATLRLIDVKTGRYIKSELLEPSTAPTRAIQVGKLAMGEYKMEVVLPDTVYWKTVRVKR